MPSRISRHGITVHFEKVTPKEAHVLLSEPWCKLNNEQQTKFFLSWQWIGPWLLSLPSSIKVNTLVFEKNDEVVGVAAVPELFRKSLFWKFKQGHLNRSGDDSLDQIWIENNKVLTSLKNPAYLASLYELIMEEACLDELMITVMSGEDYANATEFKLLQSLYNVEIEYEENGYYLPIYKDESVEKKYSKSLKKQLKQTVNCADSLGLNLRFEEVTDAVSMKEILEKSSHWHIEKWRDTATPSGFANEHFVGFHRELIDNSEIKERCRVRLFALWDGDLLLGILYGMQEKDWFGFYLSSIKQTNDNRLRLGLYMHHKAIGSLAKDGINVYDFMAGEARYKKQFGSICMRYGKMAIRRKKMALDAERWLKRMKNLIDKKS